MLLLQPYVDRARQIFELSPEKPQHVVQSHDADQISVYGCRRIREELRADSPELEDEDIRQALAYAAAMRGDEMVETKTAQSEAVSRPSRPPPRHGLTP